MRASSSLFIRNVAVVGGTHGNELAGPLLVKYFSDPKNVKVFTDSGGKVKTLIANTRAWEKCTRYVEEDLNRCFTLSRLLGTKTTLTWEERRAAEINQELGPKGQSQTDFIFDLHNSTANTGVLLCFRSDDLLSRELYAHLHSLDHTVRAVFWDSLDPPFLPTIGKSGMTVEIGPVSHGSVDYRSMARAKRLIHDSLVYFSKANDHFMRRAAAATTGTEHNHVVPIFKRVVAVDFPKTSDGQMSAFVAPDLIGLREFHPDAWLQPNQPMFVDMEGNVAVKFDKEFLSSMNLSAGKYFPNFINEAAYYEKKVAFFLNEVVEFHVTTMAATDAKY